MSIHAVTLVLLKGKRHEKAHPKESTTHPHH
jgi:hypothetical protein